jgi:integrase
LPKARLTIDDYWRRWWEQEVVVAKARGTQFGYRAIYSAYVEPRIGQVKLRELIEDPQILVRWRSGLAQAKSQAVVVQAQRVLSSMLSAAAEEGVVPHNPFLLLESRGSRGRARKVARAAAVRELTAIDPVVWFLVLDHLRRPSRPGGRGVKPRERRYLLDRERDALIVALGFMAGLRLPSEALGLTREDVRSRRLHVEGRSSSGESSPARRPGRAGTCLCSPSSPASSSACRAYSAAGKALESGDF